MNEDLQARVGMISGRVWNHLYANGESTIAQLKKSVLSDLDIPMGDSILAMSLGWLLREDKLVLSETGKGKGYRLTVDLSVSERGA